MSLKKAFCFISYQTPWWPFQDFVGLCYTKPNYKLFTDCYDGEGYHNVVRLGPQLNFRLCIKFFP